MLLKEKLKDYNIILASGSPRRQAFFKEFDIDFEIRIKPIEEQYPKIIKAEDITDYIAESKAIVFEDELEDNDLLITSDTIVWAHERAYGKPKNFKDAYYSLSSLSNSTHEVITSVGFKTTKKFEVIHEITRVTFGELTQEMVLYYLKKYKPYDKAGSYGIQEWIGSVGVKRIVGSYNNIMGFPTEKVYNYLMNFENK